MGAGGTWRVLFRKHVLIAFTGEELVLRAAEHKKVCDPGGRDRQNARRVRLQKITATDKDRRRQ